VMVISSSAPAPAADVSDCSRIALVAGAPDDSDGGCVRAMRNLTEMGAGGPTAGSRKLSIAVKAGLGVDLALRTSVLCFCRGSVQRKQRERMTSGADDEFGRCSTLTETDRMTTQRCDEGCNGQTIDLAVGQTIEIRLSENPTTGFR